MRKSPAGGSKERKAKDKDVAQFYAIDSATYDEKRFLSPQGEYVDRIHKEIIIGMVDSWEGKKVLELAAGTGRFSIALAQFGAKVVSSDIAEEMLRMVKGKASQVNGIGSIDLLRMDAQSLAIKDATFDGCICINALEHIREYHRVLKEVSRVVKPGGFLIVNFSLVVSPYLPIAVYVNLTQRSIQNDVYTRWFMLHQITQSLSSAGLKICDAKGSIIFPPGKVPRPLFDLFRTLDIAVRNSILKYVSGTLFIKAEKK